MPFVDFQALQLAFKGLNNDVENFLNQFKQTAYKEGASVRTIPQKVAAKTVQLHTKPYQPPERAHRAYQPSLSLKQPSLRVRLLRALHQQQTNLTAAANTDIPLINSSKRIVR